MTDRVHVSVELELFVDDPAALRQSAFERLQSAWSSDDDFPYESPDDVPLDQAIASTLAAAVPIEFPGARRSQLSVETEVLDSDQDTDEDTGGSDSDRTKSDEDTDGDESGGGTDDSAGHSDDGDDAEPDHDDGDSNEQRDGKGS